VRDAEGALDGVVVADGHVPHAAPAAEAVDALRMGVRLAEPGPAERVVAAVRREPRMDGGGAACSRGIHYSRCSRRLGRRSAIPISSWRLSPDRPRTVTFA